MWQCTHPDYRNGTERNNAYKILAEKCQKYNPACDIGSVRSKISSLRSSFRKEWRKVTTSKLTASNNAEIHRPSLWYYDLLLFVEGEAVEGADTPCLEFNDSQDFEIVVI